MPREPVQVFPPIQEILFQAFYLNSTPLNHNWSKLRAFHKRNGIKIFQPGISTITFQGKLLKIKSFHFIILMQFKI